MVSMDSMPLIGGFSNEETEEASIDRLPSRTGFSNIMNRPTFTAGPVRAVSVQPDDDGMTMEMLDWILSMDYVSYEDKERESIDSADWTENFLNEETEVDTIDPLPWNMNLSNNMNSPTDTAGLVKAVSMLDDVATVPTGAAFPRGFAADSAEVDEVRVEANEVPPEGETTAVGVSSVENTGTAQGNMASSPGVMVGLVNPRQQTVRQPITTTLSCFDVIDGRGRGILQLPGNQTYRALVSMNKRIYARCHQHDKGKVSKGIVAAIRDLVGGRFLEYDKESKTYHDMGDKKATAKTSQALREGLKKIRQQIYSNLEIGRYQSGFDKDFLGSLGVTPVPLPAKRYFECSVQILQSLCNTR
jgi:hypothetical protein